MKNFLLTQIYEINNKSFGGGEGGGERRVNIFKIKQKILPSKDNCFLKFKKKKRSFYYS